MDDTLELQIPRKLHKLLTEMARREGKTLENFVSEIISGQMKIADPLLHKAAPVGRSRLNKNFSP